MDADPTTPVETWTWTAQERMLGEIQELARFGVFEEDYERGTGGWSPGLTALLGIPTPADALARREAFLAMVHPEDRALLESNESGREPSVREVGEVEVRLRTPTTPVRHAIVRVLTERAPDLRIRRLLGVVLDVTAQRAAEAALRASRERFASAFEHALIGMALIDLTDPAAGRLLQVNPAVCRLTGRSQEQLLAGGLAALFGEPGLDADVAALEAMAAGRLPATLVERDCRHADGRLLHCRVSIARVPDSGEDPPYAVAQIDDVTARRRQEEQLRRLALHDPLTDLPNRTLLLDRIADELGRCRRVGGLVGLLYLDLDDFKQINDCLGHDAGDDLLVEVARRLSTSLRDTDTAARLGGDEFVVLVGRLRRREEAVAVAQRVRDAVCRPWRLRGHEVAVRASIGVATADGTAGPEDLLREADSAMYTAKDAGRDGWALAAPGWPGPSWQRLHLDARLLRAVEAGELDVAYQPVHDLGTGRVVAAEALVRWSPPDLGPVPAEEFVAVAERSELIREVGATVLQRACETAVGWPEEVAVWVNVSARQLTGPGMLAEVRRVLDLTGLAPQRLVLELTERQLVVAGEDGERDLRRLADLGVRVALDDFGTGNTGLEYLRRLPLGGVKIDRTFVAGIGSDRTERSLAASIVTLGHALGLTVVGEGVEEPEQWRVLGELGCDLAQGYLLGRPVPADAVSLDAVADVASPL
ncbi:MAG: EAL domain-containing protein [Kineosporiaceae bacterium]